MFTNQQNFERNNLPKLPSFNFFNLKSFMTKVLDMADDTNCITSEFWPKFANLKSHIPIFDKKQSIFLVSYQD